MYSFDPPDDDPDGDAHRDADYDDSNTIEIECCIYCGQSYLSPDCYPYCCWICAIDAEQESAIDKENA